MAARDSSKPGAPGSQQRTLSWEHKHSQAIVWDPLNHEVSYEAKETLDSKLATKAECSILTVIESYDTFKVHIPRWRNRVDIYLDDERKAGFVTSIDLGKLGLRKNMKRRLRYNYTVLHIKGAKPGMPSRTNTDSTASISDT